jgi:hypothetical protein
MANPAATPASTHATRRSTTSRSRRRWSQHVNETSDAMDLVPDVFKRNDPRSIARSLKRSAERSGRRKASPYRSAMSMLTFYVNRAGHNLPARRLAVLERAKDALRVLFGKSPGRPPETRPGRRPR